MKYQLSLNSEFSTKLEKRTKARNVVRPALKNNLTLSCADLVLSGRVLNLRKARWRNAHVLGVINKLQGLHFL